MRLLFNENIKQHDLIVTPWLGLSVISIISIYLTLFGLSASDYYIPISIAFTVLNVWIGFKYKNSIQLDKLWLVFSCIILAAIYLLLPLFVNDLGFSVNILGNNDFVSYLFAVELLMNNSTSQLVNTESFPYYSQVYNSLYEQTRLAVVPIAFFAKLFGMKAHQFTFIFVSFIFTLNTITFFLFIKVKKMIPSIIVFLVILFNSNFLWTLFYGFIGQIFSIGLLLVIIFLINNIFKSNSIDKKLLFLTSIIFCFFAQNYPESIPYAVLPIIVYVFLFSIKRNFKIKLLNVLIVGLIILLLDYRVYVNVISIFIKLQDVKAGWDLPIASLPHMLGMANNQFPSSIGIVTIIIVNAIISLFIYLYARERKFVDFYSVVLFSYLATYIFFIFKYDLYKIYKANVSFTYIVVIAVLSVLAKWINNDKNNKQLKIMGYSFLIVLLVMNTISSSKFYIRAIYNANTGSDGIISSNHEIINYYMEKEKYKNSNVILNIDPWWDEMVAEYFSHMGRTYVTSGTGYSLMTSRKIPEINDIYITHGTYPDIIKFNASFLDGNKNYSIYDVSDNTIYPFEKNGLGPVQKLYSNIADQFFVDTYRQFADKKIDIKFNSKHDQKVKLEIDLFKINNTTPSTASIILNGASLGSVKVETGKKIIIDNVIFPKDTSQLIIETDNEQGLGISKIVINDAKYPEPHAPYIYRSEKDIVDRIVSKLKRIPEINTAYEENRLLGEVKINNVVKRDNEMEFSLDVRNNSDFVWSALGKYPINIGIHLLDKDKNQLSWDYGRISLGNIKLKPSKTAKVNYKLDTTTIAPGVYYIQFHLLQESIRWFPGEDFPLYQLEVK